MWATAWQNQQNDLCAHRRLRSGLGIRPFWSESSLCSLWIAKDPMLFHVDSKDLSDWADTQDDQSLHWVHRSFCYAQAHQLFSRPTRVWSVYFMIQEPYQDLFKFDRFCRQKIKTIKNLISGKNVCPQALQKRPTAGSTFHLYQVVFKVSGVCIYTPFCLNINIWIFYKKKTISFDSFIAR